MKLSKESRVLSRKLFQLCLHTGRVHSASVREVVDSLLSSKPRQYLLILEELLRLVRLALAEREVRVESAAYLTESAMAAISAQLHQEHGNDLQIHFVMKPELLGGMRIQMGSQVWDGSILNRLRILSQAPTSSEVSPVSSHD